MNKNHEVIRKITLAALMLVFNIIFNRLFMIFSITPLNKIGVADVFTVFSSMYLGPLYGFAVGGFGDLLGALIVPTGSINFYITIAKFISGLLPGILYILFIKIKNQKVHQFISYGLMTAMCILITIFINVFPSITIWDFTFNVELWAKILFPCLAFVFSIGLFVCLHLTSKKFNFSPKYETWSIVIIYEICFPLIINTIAKSLFFNVSFLAIFIMQLLLFIIDVVSITLVLNLLERVRKFSRI